MLRAKRESAGAKELRGRAVADYLRLNYHEFAEPPIFPTSQDLTAMQFRLTAMQFRNPIYQRVNRAFCVAAIAIAPWCVAGAEELAVGAAAPDFKLIGSDGKTYTNAQYKGRQAVVIAWFPKAFTGGCTKECISFREGREALSRFDVAYFTASCDPADRNKEFAESLRLDYPILSDSDKSVATAFGCLNSRGVANRWTYYIGKDGTILHIDKSVQPTRHAEAVAAKLKELGVAEK